MNRAIWIVSLCILIAIIIWLCYNKQLQEGFVDTPASLLATAQASVKTAQSSLKTANSAITKTEDVIQFNTIAEGTTAVAKATTAVSDADKAVADAATAVNSVPSEWNTLNNATLTTAVEAYSEVVKLMDIIKESNNLNVMYSYYTALQILKNHKSDYLGSMQRNIPTDAIKTALKNVWDTGEAILNAYFCYGRINCNGDINSLPGLMDKYDKLVTNNNPDRLWENIMSTNASNYIIPDNNPYGLSQPAVSKLLAIYNNNLNTASTTFANQTNASKDVRDKINAQREKVKQYNIVFPTDPYAKLKEAKEALADADKKKKIYDDAKQAQNDAKKVQTDAKDLLSRVKEALSKKEEQTNLAQANFTNQLAASKLAVDTWKSKPAIGCRNIITNATTDINVLNQSIQCNDTEFLSGYSKVTGYDAAPTDNNVTKDNIAQYLAYKYSCCTAPMGSVGNKGTSGLPGTDGINGTIGDKGATGQPGSIGAPGPKGSTGKTGEQGKQGQQGADGARGPPGPKGDNGKNIKSKEVKQVAGPAGPKGPDGPMGPMGPMGNNGIAQINPSEETPQENSILGLLALKNKITRFLYD